MIRMEFRYFLDLWQQLFQYRSLYDLTAYIFRDEESISNCSIASYNAGRQHIVGRNWDNYSNRPHFFMISHLTGCYQVKGHAVYDLFNWIADGINEKGLSISQASNGEEYSWREIPFPADRQGNFSAVSAYCWRTAMLIRFEELYRQFSSDVYRFALYLTGDRALSEDITSETFVRAWSSASPIRMATVKAYLLAIARNLYVEELRRRGRHTELPETLEDQSDLARQTEARNALDKTAEALQKIPEGDRTALLMRNMDEMSYEDIAAALGISIAAVKMRIFRARLRITEIQEALEWKT